MTYRTLIFANVLAIVLLAVLADWLGSKVRKLEDRVTNIEFSGEPR